MVRMCVRSVRCKVARTSAASVDRALPTLNAHSSHCGQTLVIALPPSIVMLRLRQLSRLHRLGSGRAVVVASAAPSRHLHRASFHATPAAAAESHEYEYDIPSVPNPLDFDGPPSPFRQLSGLSARLQLSCAGAGSEFLVSTRQAWFADRTIDRPLHEHIRCMHAALEANQTTKVFHRFEMIQQDTNVRGLHTEVFNSLLQACVKLKQPEASVKTITPHARMGQLMFRVQCAHVAAVAFFRCLLSSAVATFDSLFQHNLQPTFFTYIYVIDALLESVCTSDGESACVCR
jgi:hypothetical protein